MGKFDISTPQQAGDGGDWTPLATGQYVMEIVGAKVAPSAFENDKGETPDQLTITWGLVGPLTEEQEEAGYTEGQRVYQRMAPWYGTSKNRGDSKFKMFIDSLVGARLISPQFYIAEGEDADNQGDLLGIKMTVMVECYAKTQGVNKGKMGNRVLACVPIRGNAGTAKRTPPAAPASDDSTPNIDDMSTSELRGYAATIAVNAGKFWAEKTDWDDVGRPELVERVGKMHKAINAETVEAGVPLPF